MALRADPALAQNSSTKENPLSDVGLAAIIEMSRTGQDSRSRRIVGPVGPWAIHHLHDSGEATTIARVTSHAMPLEIVVTAAREAQARGYRAFLADRQERGDFPREARWAVVTDPGGRRAGSGAATALALQSIRGRGRDAFRGRRVLIVHSGGDSRRLPAFAALGKAFAPLPARRSCGALATIFDLVLADLMALPQHVEGDIIVASGDAVVGAGREGIDCAGSGVVGIAQSGSVERGGRHGVYVAARDGRVRDFLQKPTADAARRAGAVRDDGTLLIDTGIVRFAPDAADELLAGFGVRGAAIGRGLLRAIVAGDARPVDLYEHVLTALVPALSPADFRARLGIGADDRDAAHLAALHAALRTVDFRVRRSATEGFLHLGTTRECLDLLLRDRATSARYGLESPRGGVRALGVAGCRIAAASRSGAAVIGCMGARLSLAGENLVFGLPRTTPTVALARGFGCVALPIGARDWATILFHVDDDAKSPLDADPRWAGTRLRRFLEVTGLRMASGGAGPGRATLWDAPLWRVTPRPMIEPWMMGPKAAPAAARRVRRHSLAELLDRVNHDRIVGLEREIAEATVLGDPHAALRADDGLGAEAMGATLRPASRRRLVAALSAPARLPALERARALAVAARIVGGSGERALRARALTAVGEAVATELSLPRTRPTAAIRPDETVWTSAPARIDLAGGWSDTPPICQERGGAVVNLAIDLDNRPPVHAIAKLAEEPVITVHSVDLGEHRTIRTSAELFAHRDPRDWTALAKAALRVAGIAPPSPSVRLERWLSKFGGGLSLSLLAAVPKGSGLGTSSILGATVLACLDRVVGRRSSRDALISRTSLLEQMIATRGGWQDQIGGIEAGLKIARSEPGIVQRPTVETIALSPAFERELNERTVLCFTGRRRMARDILERVVERYLARDRGVLSIISQLKDGAERMGIAAREGDIDGFAREVGRYWSLKVQLDPLASTPEIEAMAAPFVRSLLAWTLPGAGAGGFLFFIARDRRAAERIRRAFRDAPPNPLARPVEWSIARHGLRSGSV